VKIIITNILNIKNCFACVPYRPNQTKSLLNHLKFNEFKSFTSAGHRCKQPDDTKIDRRAVVNNKKNPLCGLTSRSRNAKFYFKRDFRPDPLRWSVFLLETFLCRTSRSFVHEGFVAVPISPFYVKKSIFRNFNQFFDGGVACRPRRDHRATYSSSVNFSPNFKPLHSALGARIAEKSRKKLKSLILLWNQFRYLCYNAACKSLLRPDGRLAPPTRPK
jgi:hypothetical protein